VPVISSLAFSMTDVFGNMNLCLRKPLRISSNHTDTPSGIISHVRPTFGGDSMLFLKAFCRVGTEGGRVYVTSPLPDLRRPVAVPASFAPGKLCAHLGQTELPASAVVVVLDHGRHVLQRRVWMRRQPTSDLWLLVLGAARATLRCVAGRSGVVEAVRRQQLLSFRHAICSVVNEDFGKPLGCRLPLPMIHKRRFPLPSPYFFGFALNSTAISRETSGHMRFGMAAFASFSDAAAPLPHTLDQSMHINCSQRAGWGAGRSSRTFRSVACHHRGRLPCRAEGLVTRRSHSSGCCARTRPSRSARAARRAARWWRWWASTWPVGVDRYLAG
jgi:hypothetical protein